MLWCIEIAKTTTDPEAKALESDIRDIASGISADVRITRLYYLEGEIGKVEAERIAAEVLCDPVCETVCVRPAVVGATGTEVLYNPGVMDPSVASIARSLSDLGYGHAEIRTGRAYEFQFGGGRGRRAADSARGLVVKGLLVNPVIQHTAKAGEQVFVHTKPKGFVVLHPQRKNRGWRGLVKPCCSNREVRSSNLRRPKPFLSLRKKEKTFTKKERKRKERTKILFFRLNPSLF